MRRNLTLTALIVIIALSGCGKPAVINEAPPSVNAAANPVGQAGIQKSEEPKGKSIEVDKGLLSVDVKLPASFFKGANIDEVISKAKADGVSEVIKNDDGSLTYKMNKATYANMMKKVEEAAISTFEGVKNNKDLKSFKDAAHNKTFSEYTITVDQQAYKNSFDGFAILGLYISSAYYQLFSGVDQNSLKTTILLKNADTGEIFDTIIYPDALNKKSTP